MSKFRAVLPTLIGLGMGYLTARAAAAPAIISTPYDGPPPPVPEPDIRRADWSAPSVDYCDAWWVDLDTIHRESGHRAADSTVYEAIQADALAEHWFYAGAWAPVITRHGDHAAVVAVQRDVVRIGRTRVCCSYDVAQRIALDRRMVLPTAHVCDAFAAQAQAPIGARYPWRHYPQRPSWVNDGTMARPARFVEQSHRIDRDLLEFGENWTTVVSPDDLPVRAVANHYKWWIISTKVFRQGIANRSARLPYRQAACNHGFYNGPARPEQNRGCAHFLTHSDYSQGLRLMGPVLDVIYPDGSRQRQEVADVARDPDLHPLVTGSEGPLESMTHPAFEAGPTGEV